MFWKHIARSSRCVRIGWFISFVLPIFPALFPLELVLKSEVRDSLDPALVVSLKFSVALGYALQLFPVVITFRAELFELHSECGPFSLIPP
jgi:hypothetical protein